MPDSLLIIPDTDPPELRLYGTVGLGYFEDGFTDIQVLDALAEIGRGNDVVVRVNSGGGLIVTGKAIFNALATHKGKVTVSVDAMAASSASLIAMAGDSIIMRQGALMMVHKPSLLTIGDESDHEKSLAYLAKEGAVMRDIYADRTGQEPDEVAAQMEAETWLTGDEAKELGYCDKVENGSKAIAIAAFPYGQLYDHAPKPVLATARKYGWTRARGSSSKTRKSDMGLKPQDNPNPNPNPNPAPHVDPPSPPQPPAPVAMNAADVVDLCASANVPQLAATLIRANATEADVRSRIATAQEIRSQFAAARKVYSGLPASMEAQLIASGKSVAEAKADIWDSVVAAQAQNPTNSPSPYTPPQDVPGPRDPRGRMTNEEREVSDRVVKRANARFQRAGGANAGFYAPGLPAGLTGSSAPKE